MSRRRRIALFLSLLLILGLVASGKAQTQPMCIKFTHVRAHTHNSRLAVTLSV